MTVKINIQGIPKALAYLKLKTKNIDKQTKESMQKVGRLMQNEVKLRISGHAQEPRSFDTGHLMRSVDFIATPVQVVIFSDVPYANAVENSTRIKGGPRRHFQNSLNRNKQNIFNILREGVKNI